MLSDLGDLSIGADNLFYNVEQFSGDYFESLLAEAQEEPTGESPEDTPGKSGGRKRVRKRSERAIKLNRAAQARYRERKKSRVAELESALSSLQQQLAQLQSQAQVRARALERERVAAYPPALQTGALLPRCTQEQETRLREAEVQRDMLPLQKESAVLAGTAPPETVRLGAAGPAPLANLGASVGDPTPLSPPPSPCRWPPPSSRRR